LFADRYAVANKKDDAVFIWDAALEGDLSQSRLNESMYWLEMSLLY
jgi:hypothetical protein